MFLAAGLIVGYAGSQYDRSRGLTGGAEEGGDVLARVEGTAITGSDVRRFNPSEFMNLERQLHDLRTQTLESAIHEELIGLEAAAQEMEPQEYLNEELSGPVDDPTDEEVEAFYRERRLQGSLEAMTPQIRAYLTNQARTDQFTTLMSTLESQYDVDRILEPFRVEVESEGFPARGPEDAPVNIVVFSDFQCPYCRTLLPALDQVEEEYGNQVRLVFRQFPLTQLHPEAMEAAEASLCAEEQGRFWDMHDAMFANQRALGTDQLKATARELGMDGEAFDQCMDTNQHVERIVTDLQAGQALGVRGTPMTFINGRALSGAKPFAELAAVIEDELERAGRD
jgi:protein-disulfide isomerase